MNQGTPASGIPWRTVEEAEQRCLGARERPRLGLAFSGGGIRSATFNLGVAQALARLGLLSKVDYLSTVSGGGYMGGFLQAWLYRCYYELRIEELERRMGIPAASEDAALRTRLEALENALNPRASAGMFGPTGQDLPLHVRVSRLEQQLGVQHAGETGVLQEKALDRLQRKLSSSAAKDGAFAERGPIEFLRQYSNYLTPRTGLFTVDTWTVLAIYVRNLTLNGIVLASALAAGLLTVRLLAEMHERLQSVLEQSRGVASLVGFLVLVSGGISLTLSLRLLGRAQAANSKRKPVYWGVVVPILLSAGALSALLPELEQAHLKPGNVWWLLPLAYAALWSVAFLFYRHRRALAGAETRPAGEAGGLQSPTDTDLRVQDIAVAALLAASFGTLLMGRVALWLGQMEQSTKLRAAFGSSLVLAVLAATLAVQMGLAGRGLSEYAREWGSRLMAHLLLWGVGIAGLTSVALYGPLLATQLDRLPGLFPGLTVSWVVTTVGGLIAARQGEAKQASALRRLLVMVAPYAFSLGALIAMSVATQAALVPGLATLCELAPKSDLCGTLDPRTWLFCGVLLLGVLSFVLSWRLGVNEFSLHTLYRNRLVRCYLGAVRGSERHADLFTGFDADDDSLRLEELSLLRPASPARADDANVPLLRPLFIVNATLNLVVGQKLAWQFRRASSFVFTPLYSGYEPRHSPPSDVHLSEHAYRSTPEYGGGISLGTAVAISGAALSPNMGARTSPAMAFLMTIFNVRLGWWLGNPRNDLTWTKAGPTFGLVHLLFELLAKAGDTRRFVYLSDGGHFENLGIYELVRRRCRYIIASDAGQDPELAFKDLGNAIQKCREDFGVQIDIDLTALARAPSSGLSSAHCVAGHVRYPSPAPGAAGEVGTLVYLKASLSGDEPVDVQSYARDNAAFPHQSTTDQWFDEAQFESYRALGEHAATSAFDLDGTGSMAGTDTEALFVRLWQQRLAAAGTTAAFSRHGEALREILAKLRASEDLKFLDAQIYPEWEPLLTQVVGAPRAQTRGLWLPTSEAELRAGFYICQELIQLMENVYLDLALEQTHNHPDHRGWMNLFRHWSWSSMMRVTWAIVASTMGARFQTFCHRELGLELVDQPGEGDGRVKVLVSKAAPLAQLAESVTDILGLNFREAQLLKELASVNPSGSNWRCFAVGIEHRDPAGSGQSIRLPVGFGVLQGERLVYLRIQDHLRNAGMARGTIRHLMRAHLASDAGNAEYKGLSEPVRGSDRQRFEALFRSVRREGEAPAPQDHAQAAQ